MTDAPKLLIEWSSPWQEFLSAIGPALRRSPKRLAGEARTGLWPYRGMLVSWTLEAALLAAVIIVPAKFSVLRTIQPPPLPKYEVIYYSGDELPRTEDNGGAKAGRSGQVGGEEAHHRSQSIRVARGDSLRDKVVDAPKVNLPVSDAAVANLLAYKAIPGPPPAEGLKSSLRAPQALDSVVPPAADVSRDKFKAAPALTASVVAPPPAAPERDLPALVVPGNHPVQIVPPPVSAPEQVANLNPKLTLPAPAVVAPPPQVAHDIAKAGPGYGPGDLRKQVVPPPVQVGSVTAFSHGPRLGKVNVVPPPVQLAGAAPGPQTVNGLGSPSVVPPPVQVASASGRNAPGGGLGGSGTGVVAPPANAAGIGALRGQGRGTRGGGLGGPFDVGSIAAPPANAGGANGGTGVVVSSQPGSRAGLPSGGGAGALAMSPAGGNKPGLGGSGGGTGIGRGTGPGSGFSGDGSGASKTGEGRGSDTLAANGISPYPGPGGAGSGSNAKPPVPGVAVSGGSNNIITLGSFGSQASAPNAPDRSSTGRKQKGFDVTVVATSRSGGAFNFYGTLKGDKVYTIYIDSGVLGPAVMQYADPTSEHHVYGEELIPPEPVRVDVKGEVSSHFRPSRLVIACILDRSGQLRGTQVLEPGSAEMTSKVLASLPAWKFRPAFRGDQPVEVNAILGFNIDTR
ncbi:MAG TPA: hypothetical protein VKB77_06135 [Terriglobales bacterium]|nr:hypothetical protein [Terriglobales bacterium]